MIGAAKAAFFRSSAAPFDPVSLGATVALLSTTITGKSDGDAVTTWTGMPGTSNDATAASTGPTYKTGIVNGKPILRFSVSGGADTSKLLTVPTVFGAEPYTICIVRTFTGNRVLAGLSANWLLAGHSSSGQSYYAGGNAAMLDVGAGGAGFELHTVTASGGNASYWVDGVLIGVATTSFAAGGLSIGGGGSECSNCDIGAVIGFPSALSTGDRNAVESWLAGIFGITI